MLQLVRHLDLSGRTSLTMGRRLQLVHLLLQGIAFLLKVVLFFLEGVDDAVLLSEDLEELVVVFSCLGA